VQEKIQGQKKKGKVITELVERYYGIVPGPAGGESSEMKSINWRAAHPGKMQKKWENEGLIAHTDVLHASTYFRQQALRELSKARAICRYPQTRHYKARLVMDDSTRS